MRLPASLLILPLVFASAAASAADVPRSVVTLLGPSLGHLMAQDELCDWKLAAKIDATYRKSFQGIGLTAAQQAGVWEKARREKDGMLSAPDVAKTRMRNEMCAPAIKAQVEQDLAN